MDTYSFCLSRLAALIDCGGCCCVSEAILGPRLTPAEPVPATAAVDPDHPAGHLDQLPANAQSYLIRPNSDGACSLDAALDPRACADRVDS